MNRDDFSAALAGRAGMTVQKAREICNLIFDGDDGIIARELARARGGSVQFAGFGQFNARDLPARQSRNPKTGETFEAPATKVVRFKPGRNLKDKLAAKAKAAA
jgi:DNA-binding protein HU-beta